MRSNLKQLLCAAAVCVVSALGGTTANAVDGDYDWAEFQPIDICLIRDSGGMLCVNHIDQQGNPWFITNFASVDPDVDPSEPGATFRVTGMYCDHCVQTFCGAFVGFIFDAQITPCVDEDTNRDGNVDVDDVIDVILHWGTCSPDSPVCPCDTNDDGFINVDDLISVILAMG